MPTFCWCLFLDQTSLLSPLSVHLSPPPSLHLFTILSTSFSISFCYNSNISFIRLISFSSRPSSLFTHQHLFWSFFYHLPPLTCWFLLPYNPLYLFTFLFSIHLFFPHHPSHLLYPPTPIFISLHRSMCSLFLSLLLCIIRSSYLGLEIQDMEPPGSFCSPSVPALKGHCKILSSQNSDFCCLQKSTNLFLRLLLSFPECLYNASEMWTYDSHSVKHTFLGAPVLTIA